MNVTDPYKALISLETALEGHSRLIDGRTEKDDLSFLVNYASLLNFYDETNTVNGNWTPFLLKDPVFLLASIAKTPFKKMYAHFVQTHVALEEVLACKKNAEEETTEKKQNASITNGVNQLFNQLLKIFHLLERWIHYMLECPLTYNLKNYVIQQVKEKYSQFLWALLWLKEQLHISKLIVGIEPVNKYFYTSFNPTIWKQSNLKIPYAELLGLNYPLNTNTNCDICNSLKKTGELIFSFFNSIIEYTPVEFENIKKEKHVFPDTLLLQTFTSLMKIYKKQVNGLAEKHLNFYYKDILHQKKQEAIADAVFISTTLAGKESAFELQKNSLFVGGQYEDEQPILYKTTQNVSLNPAAVSEVYTVAQKVTKDGYVKLYKHQEKEVNTIQTTEEGTIKSWKTFGSGTSTYGEEVALGFAIASPMLLLKEGHRVITLTFTFLETDTSLSFFDKGTYCLSTEEAWYTISEAKRTITEKEKTVVFTITLEATDPAIVSFTESPEGYTTSWPVFKMSFTEFTNLASPPVIDTIKIDVEVTALNTFQLYNDFGLLESEKPFQPLGPTPEKDQSFMIGSAEIFSKPVQTFCIRLDWANLPDDFITYYQQYNRFLNGYYNEPPIPQSGEAKESFLNKIWPFKKKKEESEAIEPIIYKEPFNDCCFKVEFQLLQNKNWVPFTMMNADSSFLAVLLVKSKYITSLFSVQFNINTVTTESLKVTDILTINRDVNIQDLFTINACFKVIASLTANGKPFLEDELEIDGWLQIDNRLGISDIIKIKEEVNLTYVIANEETLKVTEVFEINRTIRVQDVFGVNKNLTIKNTVKVADTIRDFDFQEKVEKINSLDLQLTNQVAINTSLLLSEIIGLNEDLLLKDLLKASPKEVLTLKKPVTIGDFLEGDFEKDKEAIKFKIQGQLSLENRMQQPTSVQISGSIYMQSEMSITNNLSVNTDISFSNIIEVTDTKKIKVLEADLCKEMYQYSTFKSTKISEAQYYIDPTIQLVPLELTEATNSGFVRMRLADPKYGFGAAIYAKVVSTIALYNADSIALNFKAENDTYALETPANEPYTPVVNLFKGSYTSSITYNFSEETNNYPVQCFYEDVFKTYSVYDSGISKETNGVFENGFPALLPSFNGLGKLYIALEEMIAPAEVSLYFELAQKRINSEENKQEITYTYLSEKGWQLLPVIANTTNNFNCSGIITFNVASNITKTHHTMPEGVYWIAIEVADTPDNYNETTFLTTNGIKLERTGKEFRHSPKKPHIEANAIESPYIAIPELATIVQPFPSFGGKAAETERHLNKRVSIRLKTKDRVVTAQDYYRVITEAFPEIYYVKTIYNQPLQRTEVYLVENVQKSTDTNAFRPLLSYCFREVIQQYVQHRASEYAQVSVRNFEFVYLKITGEIQILPGNSVAGVAKEVNNGISVFLSPWITSKQSQIAIDKGVSTAQIAEFIKSYKSIKAVNALTLYLGEKNPETGRIVYSDIPLKTITTQDLEPYMLLVPSLNNQELMYR
ncbi:hypothetical protein ACQY1Q_11280 [Tenacibaculum sp. TC6]|uniref:hypothetical protein n=1 Tax=Tenacibaculum sp. TC6 TaxID=3423223 RepID=UPI003D367089